LALWRTLFGLGIGMLTGRYLGLPTGLDIGVTFGPESNSESLVMALQALKLVKRNKIIVIFVINFI